MTNENNDNDKKKDPDADLFEKVKHIDTRRRQGYGFKDLIAFSLAAFQVLMPVVIGMIAVMGVITLILFAVTD